MLILFFSCEFQRLRDHVDELTQKVPTKKSKKKQTNNKKTSPKFREAANWQQEKQNRVKTEDMYGDLLADSGEQFGWSLKHGLYDVIYYLGNKFSSSFKKIYLNFSLR